MRERGIGGRISDYRRPRLRALIRLYARPAAGLGLIGENHLPHGELFPMPGTVKMSALSSSIARAMLGLWQSRILFVDSAPCRRCDSICHNGVVRRSLGHCAARVSRSVDPWCASSATSPRNWSHSPLPIPDGLPIIDRHNHFFICLRIHMREYHPSCVLVIVADFSTSQPMDLQSCGQ